jgi:hypothetical protein
MSTSSTLQNLPSSTTAFTAIKAPRQLLGARSKPNPTSSSGHTVEYLSMPVPTHGTLRIAARDPEAEIEEYDSSAIKLRFIEEARGRLVAKKETAKAVAPTVVEKRKGKEKEAPHPENRAPKEKDRPRKRPRKQF